MVTRFCLGLMVIAALGCSSKSGPTSGAVQDPGSFPQESRGTDPGLAGAGGAAEGRTGSAGGLATVYFDFDKSLLRGDAKATLQRNAEFLRSNGSIRVEVQGNCDERGSEEYNLALGMRRAEVARRYLIDLGIESSRIDTISFGEENPAVRGHNEAAWARNRRDDFVTR